MCIKWAQWPKSLFYMWADLNVTQEEAQQCFSCLTFLLIVIFKVYTFLVLCEQHHPLVVKVSEYNKS